MLHSLVDSALNGKNVEFHQKKHLKRLQIQK